MVVYYYNLHALVRSFLSCILFLFYAVPAGAGSIFQF